jgi:glycosyltransferase involved in cell wall biosynthesis
MRILFITTDAFGAHGGIAQYNRDLLTALTAIPEVDEVVALPRNLRFSPGVLPAKLRFHDAAAGSKFRFLREALTVARGRFDLLLCGHINLLPLAAILNLKIRAPHVLMVYGIDAWRPHSSLLVRYFLRRVDEVWSISEITRDKMAAWSGLIPSKFVVVPNAIHLDQYRPGPKDCDLLDRYGLSGRKVIMMLGRLSASERYKGVDEVLEVMPRLIQREPKLTALVAGDGDDRARLERKALDLGLADRVVFTGFVPEAEKSNHLRLADAFVMPSQGEGFGFVFLEALACGVPVVASKIDGSREAVRHGQLGRLVDPRNPAELEAAILAALSDSRGVPDGLAYFDYPEFQKRIVKSTREAARR